MGDTSGLVFRATRVLQAFNFLLLCGCGLSVLQPGLYEMVSDAHVTVHSMDFAHRASWIEGEILASRAHPDGLRVHDIPVCNRCWYSYHGVGKTPFYNHKKRVINGTFTQLVDGRGRPSKHNVTWWEAHTWLQSFGE